MEMLISHQHALMPYYRTSSPLSLSNSTLYFDCILSWCYKYCDVYFRTS